METRTVSVLLTEDNPDYVQVIGNILEAAKGVKFQIHSATTLSGAIEFLQKTSVDVLILDLSLPDSQGTETFYKIQKVAPQLPIIVLTGTDDDKTAIQMVHHGAEDYLVKGDSDLNVLERSLLYAIERKRFKGELTRLASFPMLNPDPIWEVDPYGKIIYINPAAHVLFPDLMKLGPNHPLVAEWQILSKKSAEENKIYVKEVTYGNRLYQGRIHRIEPQGILRFYLTDITERRDVEKLKEEFIHNVTHELSSPVSTIYAYLRILQDQSRQQSMGDKQHYLQMAEKSTNHLQGMIHDLLSVTKLRIGKLSVEPRKTIISDIIEDTQSSLQPKAQEKKITLLTEHRPNLPAVYADPVRSRQILTNLLGNAIKFTPSGGRAIIKTELFEENPDFLQITVTDTGPGISPQDTERVFHRLYQSQDTKQARQKGLGIGLYICKELVTRQSGKIWVKSVVGEGSQFAFTLPIFSLRKILSPLAKSDISKMRSIAFIIVELISDQKNILTEITVQDIMQEVRNLIKQTVYRDEDLLLPEMGCENQIRICFLLVKTDDWGAKIIAQRIQDKLMRYVNLNLHGLKPNVSSITVELASSNKDSETFLNFLIPKIDDLVKQEIAKRT